MEKTQVKVETEIETQLIEQAMIEARPALSQWYDEQTLRDNLATEIARDLACSPEEGVRTVELSNERVAIVYVPRADSTHPNPWSIVRRRTFAVADQTSLHSMGDEVRQALAPYKPNRLTMFVHGQPLGDSHVVDYLVAGVIDELRKPGGAEKADLRLIEPQSMDFYEIYRAWYEEFWRRRPHLREVWIEKPEDIEDCLNQGGLRLIYVGDELCGMLAAQRRIEYGLRGWRMRERVTAPAYWSRGISTAAFVPFAHSLEHDERDAIWGNILPENTSSLNSALRLGRQIVGTYYEA